MAETAPAPALGHVPCQLSMAQQCGRALSQCGSEPLLGLGVYDFAAKRWGLDT